MQVDDYQASKSYYTHVLVQGIRMTTRRTEDIE